jgi:hypothetical protein
MVYFNANNEIHIGLRKNWNDKKCVEKVTEYRRKELKKNVEAGITLKQPAVIGKSAKWHSNLMLFLYLNAAVINV